MKACEGIQLETLKSVFWLLICGIYNQNDI
jgi:hypothetical protein